MQPDRRRTPAARRAGTLCVYGALAGAAWSVVNTVAPNSSGSVDAGNFIILDPLVHRLEHLSAALVIYPALLLGIAGFVAAGLAGRGWFPRVVLGVAALATAAVSGSSLVEAAVLQAAAADTARGYGVLVLLLLVPLCLGIAALAARAAPLALRLWPLGLALLLVATGVLGSQLGAREPLAVGVLMLGWAAFGHAVRRAGDLIIREPLQEPAPGAVSATTN